MCGLVGMAGDLGAADRKIFRNMLDVCQVRGRDSTGVINVNQQNKYATAKALGPPSYLFDTRQYDTKIDIGFNSALIGHCRHKTSGDVSIANAHPFVSENGKIVGVHNGTLRNHTSLDGWETGMVDSEAMINDLSINGPEKTFAKVEGAFAVVWWDTEELTLNFIRNRERPLHFTWSHDFKSLLWASEPWMFGAVERDNPSHLVQKDLWDGDDSTNGESIFLMPTNRWWSYKITPNAGLNKPKLKFESSVRIEPAPAALSRHSGGTTYGNVMGYNNQGNRVPNMANTEWCVEQKKMVPKGTARKTVTQLRDEQKKGGEVTSPFRKTDEPELLPSPQNSSKTKVKGSKNVSKDTKKSTTTLTQGLRKLLGLSAHGTPTQSGSTTKNSQHPQSSPSSRQNNSEPPSNDLITQYPTSSSSPIRRYAGTTIRNVAGMDYITDELTGAEYSEQQVQDNTDGVCCFCDEPVGGLPEINTFLNKNNFVCSSCISQPKPLTIVG